MRKIAKLLLSIATCLFLVVGIFTACIPNKLEGLTLDIKASETVEIGSNYSVSKKQAVDAKGNKYTPEIKVYCGEDDITSTLMDVFFTVTSFEEHRIEYIIKEGKGEKVFTTVLTVVDTTKPTVSLAQNLPESMQFGSTFALNKELFVVTDNSGEAIIPTFTVAQMNGTQANVLESDGAGVYTFASKYVSGVEITVEATDSKGNSVKETYTIKNSDGEIINLVKDGEYATLWTAPNSIVYSFAEEKVNGVNSDVLTITADMSNIISGEALNVIIQFDREYNLPGTLEFDILTENMLDWFSIIPYNGINRGVEIGYNELTNATWNHQQCTYDDSINTIDSIILHIQPTTNAWWQENPIDYYDETKLTVIKLANFKFTESVKQEYETPDEIPEHTLVDTNAEYALGATTVRMDNHTLEYSDAVFYGDEYGSLKISCTRKGDGYFVITDPLIKDVSAYDYIEFKIYNPTQSSIYICVAWIEGVILAAGDWTTMRVNVEDFAAGLVTDPWTSAAYSATDVSGISFYLMGSTMNVGDRIYISSVKAVKEDYSNIDCGKDTYMELIKKATPDTFAEYCTKLSTAGYEKISERTAADNMFATFVNADEYKYVYYTAYNKQVRVMTGPIASLLREDYSITVNETVTPYIATIPQPNDGEGFIFRLPDGRFIIQDGGYAGEDRVYTTLRKLVSEGDIVIAAWFISHPHADHYPGLLDFVRDHGNDESITIERVIYNYGHEEMFNAAASSGDGSSESVNRLYDGLAAYAPNVPLLKAHTGQLIDFGSATVEILYTMEDLIPTIMTNVNDSSMVIRLTIADDTIMLLNDTCYANGPMLSELWGEYLKSDIVQVAHHGMWPSVESIYHDIAAEVLLMTTMKENLQYYLVDARWADVYEAFLSYAKDMHVCGDEVIVIELPYVIQNNKEDKINHILGKDDIIIPDVIPEHTVLDTNAEYAMNSIVAKRLGGVFEASYDTGVKYGDELGSVKIKCTSGGDGYFVISNPLIKDISAYDYIEFQVYNGASHSIYIAVAWVSGVTIPAGEWKTVRVYLTSFADGDITDPWSGEEIPATDISDLAFYIKSTETNDVFYISSIKAVKEGMEEPDTPDDPDTPDNPTEEEEVKLLYHLKFEENVTDELGGNTVANGELSYVEGYNGKAVVFGDGYVALDFTPGTSSYSVAFWLKTTGISGDPAFFGNKNWDKGADLGFVFVMKNNILYFNFADAGNRTDVSTSLPSTWKTEWTHYTIAVDRKANVVRVAYNFGEFIELAIDEENRNSSFNGLDGVNLGQDGTGEYSCDFTATMDDFMLVSGVLTQENVAELKSYYGWTPDNSREHESLPTPTKDSEGYITNYVKDVELKNYLTFDEKASDECGATTEANGNLVYKDGIYGKAVDLSDGYISIKDYAPGKESFSVSFWLKTTGVRGDPAIFSNKNWNAGGSNGYIFALNGNNDIVFNVACDGERTDKWTSLPADFSKGWVHVAIVVDREANEIRIAFDFGEFVTLALDEPDKNSSFDGLGVLNIGQDGTGEYGNDFTAVMDEFMLFGGVLSENDIAALEEYYGMNE